MTKLKSRTTQQPFRNNKYIPNCPTRNGISYFQLEGIHLLQALSWLNVDALLKIRLPNIHLEDNMQCH